MSIRSIPSQLRDEQGAKQPIANLTESDARLTDLCSSKEEIVSPMNSESPEIKTLFEALWSQPRRAFPPHRQRLDAPSNHGVYIISKDEAILHVGRTIRGQDGLRQRLKDHLHGSSSFANEYLKGNGTVLRESGYAYQFLELEDARKRALLEAYTIGVLCPRHIGIGEKLV